MEVTNKILVIGPNHNMVWDKINDFHETAASPKTPGKKWTSNSLVSQGEMQAYN